MTTRKKVKGRRSCAVKALSAEELAYWNGPNEYRPYAMPLVDRLLSTIAALTKERDLWTGRAAQAAELLELRTKASEAEVARIRAVLTEYVYETTHISAMRDDGSHECRIPASLLARARSLLSQTHGGGK